MRASNPHDAILEILNDMEEDRKSKDPVIAGLGSIFAKDCVWHAIVPTMFSSIYAPLPGNESYTLPLGRKGCNTSLACFRCNKLRPNERMQLGLRVLVSKGVLQDNNWCYICGFDWVLICIECCGAQMLMDISRPQLDLLENWLDGVAGDHSCESLSRDVSGPELWKEVRILFDNQYVSVMGELGRIRNACSYCHLTNPKHRCSQCHIRRYCGDECSKTDWPQHKVGCIFAKSRSSVFEKEASYKILLNKN